MAARSYPAGLMLGAIALGLALGGSGACRNDRNCPSGDAELPFPYEPEREVCVRAAQRKSVCGDELRRASQEMEAEPPEIAAGEPLPADGERSPTKLHKYHLIGQCECFPARRAAIESCLSASDCQAFAHCFVSLGRDGWAP